MNPEATAVRDLLEKQTYGVLSTYSVDVEGFPFGSVTPYGLTGTCSLLIYISDIAQHTKNIRQDNRVALTALEPVPATAEDPQAHGRVTVMGKASMVDDADEALFELYFQRFPDSRSYKNAHGFNLFRIEPVRIRYIGGFGKIFWLEPDQLVA